MRIEGHAVGQRPESDRFHLARFKEYVDAQFHRIAGKVVDIHLDRVGLVLFGGVVVDRTVLVRFQFSEGFKIPLHVIHLNGIVKSDLLVDVGFVFLARDDVIDG